MPSRKRAAMVVPVLTILAFACSNDDATQPGHHPPAAVRDLAAAAAESTSILLTWTAPGETEDGSPTVRYDLRFSAANTTAWGQMTGVPGEPTPKAAGSPESLWVRSLTSDREYGFLLAAADAESAWSEVSNRAVGRTAIADRTPPGPVTHLQFVSGLVDGVVLSWIASGDDGTSGRATLYRVVIDRADAPQEPQTATFPSTGPAGTLEEVTIHGLDSGRSLVVRVRAEDEAGNRGPATDVFAATALPEDAHWWDGFAPAPHGAGLDGHVLAMFVYNSELVVGGFLTQGGSTTLSGIASWNGTRWSPVGPGISGGERPEVYCLGSYEGDLVVGGRFTTAGGLSTGCVARWNGSAWAAFGPGLDGAALSVVSFQGELLVSGWLTLRGTGESIRIARWDGASWQKFSSPPDEGGNRLAVFRDELFASNPGSSLDYDTEVYVERWSVGRWEPVLVGPTYLPLPFCCPGLVQFGVCLDRLIAVGDPIGPFIGMAQYDGATWNPSSPPILGNTDMAVPCPRAFGSWNGALAVGGWFRSSRAPSSCNITIEESDSWRLLGSGVSICSDYYDEPDGQVDAVAEYQGDLYVGGSFSFAGLKPSDNIACWKE